MIANRRVDYVYFVFVPAMVGLLFYFENSFPARVLPKGIGLMFWLTAAPVFWLILHLSTVAVAKILSKLRPPKWSVLLAGGILALPLLRAFYLWHGRIFISEFAEFAPLADVRMFEFSLSFALSVIGQSASLLVIWLGINALLDHYGARRRFATPPVQSPNAPTPLVSEPQRSRPAFMEDLPIHRRGTLIALKAEDHYLRVITSEGEALIHYRFSQAMSELTGHSGFQVHRSFWVAQSAIKDVSLRRRSMTLLLSNGVRVPVSQTHKPSVLARLGGTFAAADANN